MRPQAERPAGASEQEVLRSRLIESARSVWIDRLIDLSRRNNLLFYRPVQSGTIDIPVGSLALNHVLDGKAVSAQDLLPDAKDRPTRILNIARKALENLEEKGLQTLYLGVGFASWTASDGGRNAKAPIFLLPIFFKKKGRDLALVEVQIVGEAQINPILVHVLDSEFNLQISVEDLLSKVTDSGSSDHAHGAMHAETAEVSSKSLERYIAAISMLAELADHIPGFVTEPSAVIGNFAFAKLAMVNDLKEASSLLNGNAMIAAIAGHEESRMAISSSQIEIDPHTLDDQSPDQEFCVVEADSSQQCAIAGIARGQSAVVHGPPGTGKSQTITNLIATLVGTGKTVLFVAEKRAALEVVQKRLLAAGLDHLAIDLHGAELSSKKVMERISRTLTTVRNAPLPDAAEVHRQYTDRRARLNQHDARMHTKSPRSEKNLYDMQGALLRLPDAARTSVRWRGSELGKITPSVAQQIRDLLREATGFESLFNRTDSSPWTGVGFKDAKTAQLATDAAQQLAYNDLPALKTLVSDLQHLFGFAYPASLTQVTEVFTLLESVREQLREYVPTLFETDLEPIVQQLERAHGSNLRALWLGLFDSSFKHAVQLSIALRRGVKASCSTLLSELTAVKTSKERWADQSKSMSSPTAYKQLDDLNEALNQVRGNALTLQSILDEASWEFLGLDTVQKRADALAADISTPYRIITLNDIESKLVSLGAERLLRDLRSGKQSAALWITIFDYAWLNSCLDELALNDPEVRSFVGTTHDGFVDEFKSLDSDRLKAASGRVKRMHAEKTIQAMNAHPDQETLIKQEAAKTRRHKPLRTIFRDAREVMTAVCPCWMASPLSVSQLIDRNANFDYVIFDEASQVLPEDAIPAIMRGKNIVVAGDNKQLPPTGFFSAGADDGDEDESEEADGYESLLDMMLPFAKSFHLNWHYRSRDEALIAFSNHHIYEDRLVTFPGPGGPPAVTHVLVDQQLASDGQEDSSAAEIARVIELVLRHAQEKPKSTLGVITMGIKHAMRLQGAMDNALKSHPALNAFFDPDRPERFFIKNLERVQGDERDSIIMSIGYGKDRAGNLPLRFGPILSAGGRRRLNVAVTRARATMTVVSSFSHTDIDTTKVREGTGLEFLRNYLQYAASNGRIFARGEVTGEPMNDFEVDVCEALTARGMKLVPQVGCSKFRLDFGVCHPTEPGRFVLAIECDGATYHSSYTARDRDRLRQQQLENLGWTFHRIWSTDWFVRRSDEIERAWRCYQSAIISSDHNQDVPTSSPQRTQNTPSVDQFELSSSRSSIFPPIPKRESIVDYTRSELKALYEWVVSDRKLRTHDEIVDEMFAGLPFGRRGARIENALRSTIRYCESQMPR